MLVKILGETSYSTFPITEDMIEVTLEQLNQIGKGKKFDVINKTIIDDSGFVIRKTKQAKLNQIVELKHKLNALDYKTLKFIEGQLTQEEFDNTKAEKQIIREQIAAIEATL